MARKLRRTISDRELLILNALKEEPRLTVHKIGKSTDIDKTTVKHWLGKLTDKGLVIEIEEQKKRKYDLNLENVASRQDIDLYRVDGTILIFAEEGSDIGRLFKGDSSK